MVSHESALALHELGDVMPGVTHLTVPPGFRKTAPGGCVLHHARLRADEIEERPEFNVTTPLRTVIDAADSALSPEHLATAVRDGLARGLFRRASLENAAMGRQAQKRLGSAIALSEGVEG